MVVPHNFIDRLPKQANHLTHCVCFTTQLYLFVLLLLLDFHKAFSELTTAGSYIFLGTKQFCLVLPLKIFLHPQHLFGQEIEMGLALDAWQCRCRGQGCERFLGGSCANFIELSFEIGHFVIEALKVKLFTFMLDN